MTSLIIACTSAVIASAGFVWGIHLFLSKSKTFELEFVDFIQDELGHEYAIFVDILDPDRTVAIPMDAINKIVKLNNRAKSYDIKET